MRLVLRFWISNRATYKVSISSIGADGKTSGILIIL
jgi:hypothetical protein